MRLEIDIAVGVGRSRHEYALVHESPTLGVYGPSGAGKTTLLHALAGLITPTRGRIAVDGRVLFDADTDVPVHERRIAVVFQDDRLFPHMRVRENLRFGERYAEENAVAFDDIVSLLEIGGLLGRRPHTLSGGERRRVAIGRALLSAPALLLLDEPTAGLDERLRAQLLPYLRRLASTDMPLVMVSHDLDELLSVTPTLALIENGRVTGCGEYRDLAIGRSMSGALNVFNAKIIARQSGTTIIRAGSAEFVTVGRGASGDRVVVHVRAEDVALARERLGGVSIRNQLPGRVVRLSESGNGVVVELDVGMPLLAEVSGESAERLGLDEGVPVVALIKASAIHTEPEGP